MRFPKAAKGIKKIFASEVLVLLATILSTAASVTASLFIQFDETGDTAGEGVSALLFLGFAAAAVIISIIAFILKLVGVVQTSKDEPSFKIVLFLTVLGIVFSIASGCLTQFPFWYSLFSSLSSIASFIAMLFIITGIANLALQLEDSVVFAKCGTMFRVILWIGILTIIARFFAFFPMSLIAQAIVFSFSILALVLVVVQYVVYLTMLSRASKMLSKN